MKNRIFSLICAFSLILSTIITVIDFWCFNDAFYKHEYESLNTASSIGMSKDDLNKTTDVLLSYIKDYDKTLDINVNINGENRQVFNEREKAHMIDVRDLYQNAIKVRNFSLLIYAFSLVILIMNKGLNELYRGFKKALGIFVFMFGLIAFFCLIDFNAFWTNFHHIFFPSNDLWLLDPRTDILIMMVPEKFFFDLCVLIIFSIFILMLIFFIIIKLLDKRVFNK